MCISCVHRDIYMVIVACMCDMQGSIDARMSKVKKSVDENLDVHYTNKFDPILSSLNNPKPKEVHVNKRASTDWHIPFVALVIMFLGCGFAAYVFYR